MTPNCDIFASIPGLPYAHILIFCRFKKCTFYRQMFPRFYCRYRLDSEEFDWGSGFCSVSTSKRPANFEFVSSMVSFWKDHKFLCIYSITYRRTGSGPRTSQTLKEEPRNTRTGVTTEGTEDTEVDVI